MNARRQASALVMALLLLTAPRIALAQPDDRYGYCRERAKEVSGYEGAVPAEYKKRGGAIGGALKGAAAGAALGWITDSDTKKAAKRGAALGALAGAISKAKQDKKRRENAAKRRRYEMELDDCMYRGS